MIRSKFKLKAWMLFAVLVMRAPVPASAGTETSAWAQGLQGFWTDIKEGLGVMFTDLSNLGEGIDQGQIWIVDRTTGEQRPISAADPLAWPVLGPNDQTIFALRGRQLVRLNTRSGEIVPLGNEADWRKLIGVDPESNVLGFVADTPLARPAVMTPSGDLHLLPPPSTGEERKRVSLLLQENRAYTNGVQLMVKRSRRGRGYAISLVADGVVKILSDCGDDFCGQPSLSTDRRYVLFVRATPH